jgi:hypothetical protein
MYDHALSVIAFQVSLLIVSAFHFYLLFFPFYRVLITLVFSYEGQSAKWNVQAANCKVTYQTPI